MKPSPTLPIALRQLVKDSVAELGGVIRAELGASAYARIERLRRRMADIRSVDRRETQRILNSEFRSLARLSPRARLEIAHAFSLMLELMNACENAYRSHRIRRSEALAARDPGPPAKPASTPRRSAASAPSTGTVTYVLTAHPTEARSPGNIRAFHAIQEVLGRALETGIDAERDELRHCLHLTWKLFIARTRRPTVADEADHIYSIVLREESLHTLLAMDRRLARIRVRSWVGGDKDGHPGVSEKTMLQSWQLSRTEILKFAKRRCQEVRESLRLIHADTRLRAQLHRLEAAMQAIARLRPGDGMRVPRLQRELQGVERAYRKEVGEIHPALGSLRALSELFPAWVVPLELRESSDLLLEAVSHPRLAISRMLGLLGQVAGPHSPRAYAAGLIISQFEEVRHYEAAQKIISRELGSVARLPVIPLFEQAGSLKNAPTVVEALLSDRALKRRIREHWQGEMEIMLGYSDSSKEMGAFPSRLAVSTTIRELDRRIQAHGLIPVFFHGSGGSVDRGGGSIEEQIAAWPKSALARYKATIQGEMVERTFGSPEITRSQTEKILSRFAASEKRGRGARTVSHSPALARFAARIQSAYQAQTTSKAFLEMVQLATPYRELGALRMGSRPSARQASPGELKLSSLRAIPWVLCWTQTRILFPTWWGVGRAWQASNGAERASLRREYARDPLFRSYVKLLGFTLRKVETPIWRMYLEHSRLSPARREAVAREFEAELKQAIAFVAALAGSRDLLWFRPWLSQSIGLRAPMIHPLNLLQIISLERAELPLFRAAATGISSGMLTTG